MIRKTKINWSIPFVLYILLFSFRTAWKTMSKTYNGKKFALIFINKMYYEMKFTNTHTLSGAVRRFIRVYVLVAHITLARWRSYNIVMWISVRESEICIWMQNKARLRTDTPNVYTLFVHMYQLCMPLEALSTYNLRSIQMYIDIHILMPWNKANKRYVISI